MRQDHACNILLVYSLKNICCAIISSIDSIQELRPEHVSCTSPLRGKESEYITWDIFEFSLKLIIVGRKQKMFGFVECQILKVIRCVRERHSLELQRKAIKHLRGECLMDRIVVGCDCGNEAATYSTNAELGRTDFQRQLLVKG